MKKERGLGTTQALLEAGQSRLRPIVMTTVSMVCGMIPMALTSGAGAEWKEGLAWTLIGGLSSSMFFTLVLIPVVYLTVERWLEAISALVRKSFGMKAGSAPPAAAENVEEETT
jgi:HAE1 family hydrophobic/amphiphilic exporter-1